MDAPGAPPNGTGDPIGSGTWISDEELTAIAMSADPDQPLDPDARPFVGEDVSGMLPSWYMPPPVIRVRKRWHVPVVATIIASFALINALGLCITYGHLVIA